MNKAAELIGSPQAIYILSIGFVIYAILFVTCWLLKNSVEKSDSDIAPYCAFAPLHASMLIISECSAHECYSVRILLGCVVVAYIVFLFTSVWYERNRAPFGLAGEVYIAMSGGLLFCAFLSLSAYFLLPISLGACLLYRSLHNVADRVLSKR